MRQPVLVLDDGNGEGEAEIPLELVAVFHVVLGGRVLEREHDWKTPSPKLFASAPIENLDGHGCGGSMPLLSSAWRQCVAGGRSGV
mmetsp:Transcript_11213/g.25506  ORF Transcript_11213/g.25506 Transcript_11213/m.25506 type:complete len:86 (-) Transcript_11213:55-312(-)